MKCALWCALLRCKYHVSFATPRGGTFNGIHRRNNVDARSQINNIETREIRHFRESHHAPLPLSRKKKLCRKTAMRVRLSQKSQIRRRFGAFLSSGTFSASTRQNNVYIRVATLSYLAPRLNSYRYLGIALLKATATVLPTPYI